MKMNYYGGSPMSMSPYGTSPYSQTPQLRGISGVLGGAGQYSAGPDPTIGIADSMGGGNPLGGVDTGMAGSVRPGGGGGMKGMVPPKGGLPAKDGGGGLKGWWNDLGGYEKGSLALQGIGGIANIVGGISEGQAQRREEERLIEDRKREEEARKGRAEAMAKMMGPMMQRYGMTGG